MRINTNELKARIEELKCGDEILLSGTVFTARDAAHKRLFELIDKHEPLPIEICGAAVYYAGPTPEREGQAIGSCGPTTSSRMDKFAPTLLDMGLLAMIGKGPRNEKVVEAIKRNKAVYFCAVGGCGALASKCITNCEVVAFPELGCESLKKLIFKDFPLYVGIDCYGNSLFER